MVKFFEKWFIDKNSVSSESEYWKTLIFLSTMFFCQCLIILEIIISTIVGIQNDFPFAFTFLAFIIIVFVYKQTHDLQLSVNLFLFVFFLCLFPLSFKSGGIYSMDLLGMIFLPIFAFLLGGNKSGIFWYLVTVVCSLVHYYQADKQADLFLNLKSFGADYYFVLDNSFFFLTAMSAFVFNYLNNKHVKRVNDQKAKISNQAEDLRIAQERVLESNRELEQYAYVTSHDLKQPLRTINSFSSLLERDIKNNQISDETLVYLEFIKTSTENMNCLIEDILAYSQLNMDNDEQFSFCSIEQIITKSVNNLSGQIKNCGANIEMKNLPKTKLPLMTSRVLQLFQNIISNGIKYRVKNSNPLIEISSVEREDCWEFLVKDNGIGIPKKHLKSIFQPFKRLHSSQNKFKGSGIGLATCLRIVEQHNGNIWVESEEGKGSSFYFTLAKKVNPHAEEMNLPNNIKFMPKLA